MLRKIIVFSALGLACDREAPNVEPDESQVEAKAETSEKPPADRPGSVAEASEPDSPSPAATHDARTEMWIEQMRTAIPDAFCEESAFFRQCFEVTKSKCREVAAKHFEPCLRKHRAELPLIRGASSGEKAGNILGRCAGSAYEIELAKAGLRRDNARCTDPSNWGP